MKKLVTIILLLMLSTFGFGQTILSPDPKSFTQSTIGQDGSGFVLSGFNSTETLLTSISLVNPPSGTTFNLTTTNGLTAASGFTLTGNKTRLVVTGTISNINNALSSLKINTGSTIGNIQLSVAATINPTGYFYNGVNGHFYRPISAGNTYTGARAAAELTTFKGQKGYLVTITSADEDAFIYNNVPQSQIWFALTDEVSEGRWVIDAGPEKGTLIKTSNGQTSGNIQGQYNNWAGGEPNNSGNEDYAVTKWNGTQWNDLPNHFYCPYVIEYGDWTNPDDATFTEFYTNSVIHSNGEVLRAQFNFDFGSNIDETKLSTKLLAQSNGVYLPTTNNTKQLNGLGRVDMTSELDINKISDGKRGSIVGGGVEWSYVNISNDVTTLYIDLRKFDVNTQPSDVKAISILDTYNGPITYEQTSAYWAHYIVPSTLTKVTDGSSSFNSNIRNSGYGNWAFACEVSFSNNTIYKPHQIEIQPLSTSDFQSLYDNVVTVSDVFIAFKELSNGGIFGNESGNEFTSGIQFLNADVNKDGTFNDMDTYIMLQHLIGDATIQPTNELSSVIRLIDNIDYDNISKLNWNSKIYPIGTKYSFDLNNAILNTFNVNSTWLGDINLSHSATQPNSTTNKISSLTAMSSKSTNTGITGYIISELKDNIIKLDINISMNSNQTKGIQFRINYDNNKLSFDKVNYNVGTNATNFNTVRERYINLGSIIYDGTNLLPNDVSYTLYFKNIGNLKNSLGLVSISNTEAVSSTGDLINITIK